MSACNYFYCALRSTGRAWTAAFAVCVAMAASGCVSNAGWHYTPNEAAPAGTTLPVTIAVQRFKDERPIENTTYWWLCQIPAVPYCTSDYGRPDTANGFLTAGAYNFRPTADLANAAASELRQSGMFHDVFVTARNYPPGAQLILKGTVLSTQWQAAEYAYLIGPYKAVFWLLGLPIGTVNDTLKLHLQLIQQSSGAVLWTHTISEEYSKTEGYYYNWGHDFGYPQMFQTGMKGALASLEEFVHGKPAGYWDAMVTPGTSEQGHQVK